MPVSITSVLAQATAELAAGGISEARNDATLLLIEVLGRDRAFIIAHPETKLSADQLERFRSFVARRGAGEPLQYVTGHQEFFKLDFEVTPDVLIPRPETELIVEAALEVVTSDAELSCADIGTGSGCIVISLLRELAKAHATAIDISPAALAVAKRNAERHQVADRLQLLQSDGFELIGQAGKFDLIISNPPYVPDSEMQTLQREVRHEPKGALAGGPDGLAVIRRLLRDAAGFLKPRGYFIFEIGFGQGEAVKALIDQQSWELIGIRRDLANIPRTIVLRKKVMLN